MLVLSHFFHNYILMAAVLSWIFAQIIKTVITLIITKRFDPERILGAGGMPSAHSAMVCALFVGVLRRCGAASPEFALAFVLAGVVIYDAMGVRRAAGEQARVLNKLVEITEKNGSEVTRKGLKESLGHTPMEVLAGIMLGILVALAMG
ncbi:divergent PAP2 family protein [Ethanoligenens harbinense]|uniref:Acid phosphatase/vanadium-dependent haloperoxidase related protein n=1 Tax=Ethanoligenens harbinense (strain DSM 18485 / JCM 12961 / CGMCC 1.5033 / YUAN-3) TaxID=663278 RepID=E6U5K5_ETHHY|nr:divergent PAP2 family protein [Ethanoligenens harbinense]ADU26764.1 acid phosphatase/vanadium-dependent haloperoxidase related protein [Ethanoligenens harbinense YUAN-3]AVQ95870.1 divergent PAP2 family protein [Ethanoligenens harbinense YUAN-3]AYF38532.1 divergent PAP2 family protein [Ethanoligenens harbinense]AYF41279.1 divergent PAP2 family protein [Ethanoligenens harbinense]QCN92111.1 divergent PAP2 family protein [Ethanoligenens harbinense]